MSIHKFFASLLKNDKDRLLLSYHSHDLQAETVTASVTVFDENNVPRFKPFVIRGTYAELACQNNGMGVQIRRYETEVLQRTSNIAQLEREAKELEERNKKLKEKASKPPKIDKNRMAGSVDSAIVEHLCDTGVTSDEFKESFVKANMQTLLHCLTLTTDGQKGVGRFKKMASELKKITGVSAEDMGLSYDLPEKPKSEKGLLDSETSVGEQGLTSDTSEAKGEAEVSTDTDDAENFLPSGTDAENTTHTMF